MCNHIRTRPCTHTCVHPIYITTNMHSVDRMVHMCIKRACRVHVYVPGAYYTRRTAQVQIRRPVFHHDRGQTKTYGTNTYAKSNICQNLANASDALHPVLLSKTLRHSDVVVCSKPLHNLYTLGSISKVVFLLCWRLFGPDTTRLRPGPVKRESDTVVVFRITGFTELAD